MDVVISSNRLETIGDVDVLLEAAQNIQIGEILDGSLDLPQSAGQTVTFVAGEAIRVQQGIAITTQGGSLSFSGGDSVSVDSVNARGGMISFVSDAVIDTLGTVESAGGTISYSITGGDRTANIGNAEASDFIFDLDGVNLSGNLLGLGALDLTGLNTITVSDADTGATIGAIDGIDTFDITLDPAVTITGPGGLRFVGRNVTLPEINGLSRLEVSATGLLTLTGDIRMDNRIDGFGGNVDFRDAQSIAMGASVRLDTDLPGAAPAGDVLLDGASVLSDGSLLTIDTNNDVGTGFGRISLGDVTLRGLTLFGGPAELRGVVNVTDALDFSRVEAVRVEGDASLNTGGADLLFGDNAPNGPGSLAIDLGGGGGAGLLDLTGEVGAIDPLASLSIRGGQYSVPGVTTVGDQTYNSTGLIRLDGDLAVTGSGSVVFNDGVFFEADRGITTAGSVGDDILFLGSVRGNDASLTTNHRARLDCV